MNVSHHQQRIDSLDRSPAPPPPPGAMAPAAPQPLDRVSIADELVDWIGFLRRHFLAMAAAWILVMGIAVAILLLLPKQYLSEAKFLVRNARQELIVGPGAGGATMYREDVSEEILNTELELLRSRDILARVVGEVGLDRDYLAQGKPPAVAREMAVRDLSRTLGTSAIRKTNVVQVSYISKDPELSAAVVQHMTDAYLAAHLTAHSSPGTFELFRTQAEQASIALRQAEEELAAFGRSSNLMLLETQKKDALAAINDLTTQLDAISAEMREHETRAKVAAIHMERVPQRVKTQMRNVPNQYSVERLHTLLVELGNKRTEALTKFNPTDRLVQELDRQIADTTAALERAQGLSANEESTDVNPAWQALETERMKAQLALSGLESKARQLERELAEHRTRALEITEAGPEYQAVARRVEDARHNYELYSKKEEEARIAEALDKQRISNVVLAQAPIVSHLPAKPNMRLGAVAGGIAASVVALALAFVRELFGFGLERRRGRSLRVTVLGVSPATAELT